MRVVEEKGLTYTEEDIRATIDELDLNQNGGVSADEIKAVLEYGAAHLESNRQHMHATNALSAEEMAKQKFELYDADKSGNISQAELGKVLRSLGLGQGITNTQFNQFLSEQFKAADMDGNGVIDWDEFVEFYNTLVELQWTSHRDKETGLRQALHNFGYDIQLRLLSARTFVISAHSSHPVRLQPTTDVDTKLFRRAIADQIVACGEAKVHNDMVAMVTFQPPLGKGIGLAARNITGDSICEVTCEWDGGNCVSSAGSKKTTIELHPGESGLLHVLMQADPEKGGFGYTYSFGFSYRPA
jgi:Ca2+-binding EF-hand superfamily protein